MTIIGVDNVNDYYDVAIKQYRLKQIEEAAKTSDSSWIFYKKSIADEAFIKELF